MIYFIAKQGKEFTIKLFLETFGKELAEQIALLPYEKLFRMGSLPVGTYVFADLERLTPEETDNATVIWNTLSNSGKGVRLLNHPARSLRRYELLRHLYLSGVNDFNVYRLTDIMQSMRYPVFIRSESDHTGSLTPLLYSEKELRKAIDSLPETGHNRDDKIIVEFTDTMESDGLYRLYNDFIVGSRIIARGIELSHNWINKGHSLEPDDSFVSTNQRYVEVNPNESLVRPIFELSGIEYGRIDYAVVNGRLRVFEINTNPYVLEFNDFDDPKWIPATRHFSSELIESFHDIDDVDNSNERIRQTAGLKPRPIGINHRARMVLHQTLRDMHLLKHEASIISELRRVDDAVRTLIEKMMS